MISLTQKQCRMSCESWQQPKISFGFANYFQQIEFGVALSLACYAWRKAPGRGITRPPSIKRGRKGQAEEEIRSSLVMLFKKIPPAIRPNLIISD